MSKGTKSVKRCQCSKECKAVVKTASKKYARGHNPASRAELPVQKLQSSMTATDYAKYKRERREENGPYAVEKRIVQCKWCKFKDGVRAVQRHKKECPKNPRRNSKAWSAFMTKLYEVKKSGRPKAA